MMDDVRPCRVTGLTSEKGQKLNGTAAFAPYTASGRETTRSSTERISVLYSSKGSRLLYPSSVQTLSSSPPPSSMVASALGGVRYVTRRFRPSQSTTCGAKRSVGQVHCCRDRPQGLRDVEATCMPLRHFSGRFVVLETLALSSCARI